MNVITEPMTKDHIDLVYAIELASFSLPWTYEDFAGELRNKLAIYIVARHFGEIAGYAGMWHVVTEGHITNIAVKPEHRRQGIGGALLRGLIKIAEEKEMIGITLEARAGNAAALSLYGKHGFKAEGLRKGYYSDTKEDAVIMWKYLAAKERAHG